MSAAHRVPPLIIRLSRENEQSLYDSPGHTLPRLGHRSDQGALHTLYVRRSSLQGQVWLPPLLLPEDPGNSKRVYTPASSSS